MSVPLHKLWTQEEFFAWTESQGGRFEFDGVRPVAMTGGTVAHETIVGNLYHALRSRLQGGLVAPLVLMPQSPPQGRLSDTLMA